MSDQANQSTEYQCVKFATYAVLFVSICSLLFVVKMLARFVDDCKTFAFHEVLIANTAH